MKVITIDVKETAMVKPAEETPREPLWLSNVDLVTTDVHVPSVYFYNAGPADAAEGFFDAGALREALAKILVPYYPMAGRLRRDGSGRLEIDCNAEGALFIEARSGATVADFADFAPTPQMRKLVPAVDRSGEVSSFPLLLAQITYFKCGGVSLGVGVEHRAADGISGLTFVNFWSEVARGLNPKKLDPLLDRTFLRARNPPRPAFDHPEYGSSPSLPSGEREAKYGNGRTDQTDVAIATRSFIITPEHVNALKAQSKGGHSKYEIVAGHVWRCACAARALPPGQASKLYMATSGRARLESPPPPNFFGNVIFAASVTADGGELAGGTAACAAGKIRESLAKMDGNYLLSAIDFLELQPELSGRSRGADVYGSPNLGITSWVRLPLYGADFGWGPPVYVGPAGIAYEGKSYVLPASGDEKDRRLVVAIALQAEDMKAFEKFLYDI